MNGANYLKAVRFERPDFIPLNFHINSACWHHYPVEALLNLMEEHKLLFPDFVRPTKWDGDLTYALEARKDEPYTDDFGCVWETTDNGITGTVTKNPLADWAAFENYKAPNPEICRGIGPIDWEEERLRIESDRARDGFVARGLRHGHTFLQLSDLRGYQNFTFDMMDEEPKLWKLIELVEQFNQSIVDKYLSFNVDQIGYADDLGMQVGPMISPDNFRKYIMPSYQRLMKPVRDKGVIVHMHSDGDIRDLVDDIIEGGVQVINLQDLVNGIDWIAARFAGKVCVELDVDRQSITPFGTPSQIDALVREEVEKLSTPQGGLMLVYGVYPGVPLENIKAVMDALEKYSGYHD